MNVDWFSLTAISLLQLPVLSPALEAADTQTQILQQNTLYNHVANHQQVLPEGTAALLVPPQATTWSPVYAGIIYSVSRVDSGNDPLDFVLATNLKVRDAEAFKGDPADQTTVGVYPSYPNSLFLSDVLYNDDDLANSTFVSLAPGQTKEVTAYTYIGHPEKQLPSGTSLTVGIYPTILDETIGPDKVRVRVKGQASATGQALIATPGGIMTGYDLALQFIAWVPRSSPNEPPPRLEMVRSRDSVELLRSVRHAGAVLMQNTSGLAVADSWVPVAGDPRIVWDSTRLEDQRLANTIPKIGSNKTTFYRLEQKPVSVLKPLN